MWPDAHSTSEPRNGVDALTYGLATLVMREDLFGYIPPHSGGPGQSSCLGYTCNHCGMANDISVDSLKPKSELRRPRRANLFSQYTRKFSLGNGPEAWVQEYLISKEGGKMLGTLIALTIARMPNLETMIWDMPTGIVREAWQALASLGEQRAGHQSRLEKVWVRFHDNREVTGLLPAPSSSTSPNSAAPLPSPNPSFFSGDLTALKMSYDRTEHPNFSILPPLKSLTVLEIDELAYLNEISALVRQSRECLRELRIGISKPCAVAIAQKPVSSESSKSQCQALGCYKTGGVLGLVMHEIYDCRRTNKASSTVMEAPVGTTVAGEELQKTENSTLDPSLILPFSTLSVIDTFDDMAASVRLPESPDAEDPASTEVDFAPAVISPMYRPVSSTPNLLPSLFGSTVFGEPQRQTQPASQALGLQVVNPSALESVPSPEPAGDGFQDSVTMSSDNIIVGNSRSRRLTLETLELERIPLSVNVLQKTVDWPVLTTLTLFNCGDHERLWKALRRTYSPISSSLVGMSSLGSLAKQPSQPQLRRVSSSRFDTRSVPEYRLNLKRIHTDNVSPALISFLKETLAPNTLKWMLLQEHGQYESPVTVDAICRGPLRHHRSSLEKVLIDSSDRDSPAGRSTKWKKWMLNHDILTFVTGGKMSRLREIGMALDHKDWVGTILGCLPLSG